MFVSHVSTCLKCIVVDCKHRLAVTSLQRAGGIYRLVDLSPSVGVYAGGRFTSNVSIRVVQPTTHPNNNLDLKTEENSHPGIQTRRSKP
jgi:hypothetical protein